MTANHHKAHIYQFGSFTLHTAEFRLYKDDQVVDLEPKLFNLLLCLVASVDRVVTQDELIDQVWQGRVVTPNAISRAVYALRQILDDPQAGESMITTVRGRGYQFVEKVSARGGDHHQGSPLSAGNLWRPVVLLLLVLIGGWFLSQSKNRQPVEPADQTPYLSIAILPWVNESSDPRLISLAHTLVNDLMLQLRNAPINQVISPDSLLGQFDAPNDLLAVQQVTHANYLLQGFVSEPAPDLLRLHLTLHHHVGGFLEPYDLGTFDFPWPENPNDLQELYVQRKNTAREIVRLIKPKAQTLLEDQGLTPDPAVFRMLINAHHLTRSNDCDQIDRAQALLESALQKDPAFATGWHELMTIHFKNIWICGRSSEHYERALKAAGQVEKLAPGQYESVKIARNAILLEQNQVEQAYEFNHLLPNQRNRLIYLKVSNLRYAGFLRQARELIDLILFNEPFYYSSIPINQAPNTVLYLNQFEQHLKLLAEPGNQYHDYYRALNHYLSGDHGQARSTLEDMLSDPPKGLFDDFANALLAITNEQPEQAIRLIEQTISHRQSKGQSDGEITYKQVQLLALAGAGERALEMLEVTLNQGFFAANYWQQDPALRDLRDQPEFIRLVNLASERHRAFARRFELTAEF